MRSLQLWPCRRHWCRSWLFDLWRSRGRRRSRSGFACRCCRLGRLFSCNDRSRLGGRFDNWRWLGFGYGLDNGCRTASADWLRWLRLRGLFHWRSGCRRGSDWWCGRRFRLVHHFRGATTPDRWSWFGFRRRGFDSSGGTAATSGTGGRCGRGRPGALFTLPARTNSRDLIVG